MYNSRKILAHGFGFILVICILIIILIFSAIAFIGVFIPQNSFYHNWWILSLSVLVFAILIFEIIKYFMLNIVVFKDSKIIIRGNNYKNFPPINHECSDFVSYKLSSRKMIQCLEFTMKDKSKLYFACATYTKKQNLEILTNIKDRGGFQNIEISLDHFYF